MWAALQVGSRVQVEEVVAEAVRAAKLVVAVVLSGTAASWSDVGVGVGVGEIVVEADNDSAWARRGGWVVSSGTATLESVGGLSGDDLGASARFVWAADIVGWVVQVSATAGLAIWVADDLIDTTFGSGRVVSNSVTALTVSNGADVVGCLWFVGVNSTAVGVSSGLDVVVDVDGAAGLSAWVVGLGWAAALLSVGGGENCTIVDRAADLGGGIVALGSAAAQASSAVGLSVTASLGSWVVGGATTARESVGDALNLSGAAILSARGEGGGTTAALSSSTRNKSGAGTAKILGGVDKSVSTALRESVWIGNNGAVAASLGSGVCESIGAAAGGGGINSTIIGRDLSGVGITALLGGRQESGSTADSLEVAGGGWDREDGVDTANLGGSIV